jgi:hypothetical protein
MDELKFILSTKFMKNLVAKMITKAIYKKTGYDINVRLNKIEVVTIDGRVHIHADVDGDINSEDFVDIIKSNGLI